MGNTCKFLHLLSDLWIALFIKSNVSSWKLIPYFQFHNLTANHYSLFVTVLWLDVIRLLIWRL
jgi:hypothetical protein